MKNKDFIDKLDKIREDNKKIKEYFKNRKKIKIRPEDLQKTKEHNKRAKVFFDKLDNIRQAKRDFLEERLDNPYISDKRKEYYEDELMRLDIEEYGVC